ncbi:ArsR family transcriptional regulator [Actinomycetospora rhizophila]|uniref:ArsR family transcriptional regulator n=1 Tax=Actinomycetospora rhizophila TaxID=1416876 RepID=A0ABV9ZLQ0_9PSEU
MSPTGRGGLPPFVRLAAHPLRWRLLTELAASDRRVRELAARTGEPQNLVSYHLRLLRDGGLVRSARSSLDGRDTYYRLDLDRCADGLRDTGAALHPALHPAAPAGPAPGRIEVLFVCTGNSARSPLAEALLDHHSAGRVAATSAGTRPQDELHPDAVRALREGFGIDVSGRRPRGLDALADRRFDVVVTLCDKAREICPSFPGQRRTIHWSVRDPAAPGTPEGGDGAFHRAAADIDTRVRHLLPVLAATGPTATGPSEDPR